MNYFITSKQNPFYFDKRNYDISSETKPIYASNNIEIDDKCGYNAQCEPTKIAKTTILMFQIQFKYPIFNGGIMNLENKQKKLTKVKNTTDEKEMMKRINTATINRALFEAGKEFDKMVQFSTYYSSFNILTESQKTLLEEIEKKAIEMQDLTKLINDDVYDDEFDLYLDNLDFNLNKSFSFFNPFNKKMGPILNISLIEETTYIKYEFTDLDTSYSFNGMNIFELINNPINFINFEYIKIVVDYVKKDNNSCIDITWNQKKIEEYDTKNKLLFDISEIIETLTDEALKKDMVLKQELLVSDIRQLKEILFKSVVRTVIGFVKVTSNNMFIEQLNVEIDINSPFYLSFRDENDNLIPLELFRIQF
jgi:hypothetical protein